MGTVIQSVTRALHILNALSANPDGLSNRQIAEDVGLNISTTHHLVDTLALQGYVTRLENGSYCIGPAAARLYSAYLRSPSLHAYLRDAVEKLAEVTGETAYACVWRDRAAVIEAIVEGSQAVRVGGLYVGFMGNTHLRASGKALLAFRSEQHLQDYLAAADFTPLTAKSVRDQQELTAQLNEVVERGYAIDRGEYADGVNCISAPVFAAEGEVIAALTVSAPEQRFEQSEDALIEIVTQTASGMSSLLGFEPDEQSETEMVPGSS